MRMHQVGFCVVLIELESGATREDTMAQADAQKWRNMDWEFTPRPDGTLSPEQVSQSLLVDIRGLLRGIRKIGVFFTVLAAIELVVGLIYVMVVLGSG